MASGHSGPYRVTAAQRPDDLVADWVRTTAVPAAEQLEAVGASMVWGQIGEVWERALAEGLVEGTVSEAIETLEAAIPDPQHEVIALQDGQRFADAFQAQAALVTRQAAQDEVDVAEYRRRINNLANTFNADVRSQNGPLCETENRGAADAETETALNRSFNDAVLARYRTEPTVRLYPFLTYVTKRDSKVRPRHAQLDGFTARTGNPIWDRIRPPNGFRCRCVSPLTRVSYRDLMAVSRSYYTGPMVEIESSSGHILSVTSNHPIATSHGWVRAAELKPGDDIIVGHLDVPTFPLISTYDQEIPTAENLFDSLVAQGLRKTKMEASRDDFHGDGQCVVGDIEAVAVTPRFEGNFLGESESFHSIEKLGLESLGESPADTVNPVVFENRPYDASPDSGGLRDSKHRVPVEVEVEDSLYMATAVVSRSSPGMIVGSQPGIESGYDSRPSDTQSCSDLLDGPPIEPQASGFWLDSLDEGRSLGRPGRTAESDIFSDRLNGGGESLAQILQRDTAVIQISKVIRIDVSSWCGHVYDLQTRSGYFLSDGIVTHNCVLVASNWFIARAAGWEGLEFPEGTQQLSGFTPDPGF